MFESMNMYQHSILTNYLLLNYPVLRRYFERRNIRM